MCLMAGDVGMEENCLEMEKVGVLSISTLLLL